MSGAWWQRVVAESFAWYTRWVQSPAVRGLIRPTQSSELQEIRFRRLESRAYAMLQAAVPAMIREELVANREIHCVALLFHVMRVYQPGGLQERTTVVEALSNPGSSNTASEAVTKLSRAWGRALARATAMQINVPDASLMLRGIDTLSEQILKRHPHVNFRCNHARNNLQLDHYPTLQTVREYTKIIQSEFDMLAISGSALEPGPKKPKLAAMQQEGGKGKLGSGQGKDGKSGDTKGKGNKGGGDLPSDGNESQTSGRETAARVVVKGGHALSAVALLLRGNPGATTAGLHSIGKPHVLPLQGPSQSAK